MLYRILLAALVIICQNSRRVYNPVQTMYEKNVVARKKNQLGEQTEPLFPCSKFQLLFITARCCLQGLLYADYVKEKEKWEEEKRAIEEEKASTELAREHDKIRLLEFEVLLT